MWALLMTNPPTGGCFQIVDRNRLLRGYINVLGDHKKFPSNPQQSATRCAFLGAMDQESLALVGCRAFKVMSQNTGVLEQCLEHVRSPLKRDLTSMVGLRYVVLSDAYALKTRTLQVRRHITGETT